MLSLRGANGLEIPYLRYLELDVQVEGVTVPNCAVLVLKDTAATVEQKGWSPGVLGMNVLANIPEWAKLLKLKGSAGISSRQSQKLSKLGLAKVAGSSAVLIPPTTTTTTTFINTILVEEKKGGKETNIKDKIRNL